MTWLYWTLAVAFALILTVAGIYTWDTIRTIRRSKRVHNTINKLDKR